VSSLRQLKKEATKTDRRKALILLSVVAFAAMLSGLYVTAYATNNDGNSTTLELWEPGLGFRGGGRTLDGCSRNGFVEVSAEYNQTVINIAESDEDVQNLLAEGYSISGVRPIIKTVVEADGSVVTKATKAIVMLKKDAKSTASVWVDLNAGSVTRIVILTRTVIEKS